LADGIAQQLPPFPFLLFNLSGLLPIAVMYLEEGAIVDP